MSKVLAGWCHGYPSGLQSAPRRFYSYPQGLFGRYFMLGQPTTSEAIREPFILNCEAILELVQLPADKKVSIYVDRAIAFAKMVSRSLRGASSPIEVITWEKRYKVSAHPLATDRRAFSPACARVTSSDRSPGVNPLLRYQRGSWLEKSSTGAVDRGFDQSERSHHYPEHHSDRSAGSTIKR